MTGSQGFIGQALLPEIRRAFPHARIFRSARKAASRVVACDLTDQKDVKRLIRRTKPDLIFHLAGTTKTDDAEALRRSNIDASFNVLEAALDRKCRVVMAGSGQEYGLATRVLTEKSSTEPANMYGATKLASTMFALAFAKLGLDVVIARIFNSMGPGMHTHQALGAFAAQIARIERGLQPAVIRAGSLAARRDYVDVRDVARALVLLAKKGRKGQIYNVCAGRSHTIGTLLKKMANHYPKQIKIESGGTRAGDPMRLAGSWRKIAHETGWRPKISIDQSLSDTLDWHRRRLNGAR